MADHAVTGWRAWCDDSAGGVAKYDSLTTSWADLPDPGIVAIILYFGDNTRRIMYNVDYYWHEQSGGVASDWDQGMAQPGGPTAVIKAGKLVSDGNYTMSADEALAATSSP